jgi:hypothetical protein
VLAVVALVLLALGLSGCGDRSSAGAESRLIAAARVGARG